jgi:hypothetical protein
LPADKLEAGFGEKLENVRGNMNRVYGRAGATRRRKEEGRRAKERMEEGGRKKEGRREYLHCHLVPPPR